MELKETYTIPTRTGHRVLIETNLLHPSSSTDSPSSTSNKNHSVPCGSPSLNRETLNTPYQALQALNQVLLSHFDSSSVQEYLGVFERVAQRENTVISSFAIKFATDLLSHTSPSLNPLGVPEFFDYVLYLTELCMIQEEQIEEIAPHLSAIILAHSDHTGQVLPVENVRALRDIGLDASWLYEVYTDHTYQILSKLQSLSFSVRGKDLLPEEITRYGQAMLGAHLTPDELEQFFSIHRDSKVFMGKEELGAFANLQQREAKDGKLASLVAECWSLKFEKNMQPLTAREIEDFDAFIQEVRYFENYYEDLLQAVTHFYSTGKTEFTFIDLDFYFSLISEELEPPNFLAPTALSEFIRKEESKVSETSKESQILTEIYEQTKELFERNRLSNELYFRHILTAVLIKSGSLDEEKVSAHDVSDIAAQLEALRRVHIFPSDVLSPLPQTLGYPVKDQKSFQHFLSAYCSFFSCKNLEALKSLYDREILLNDELTTLEDIGDVLMALSDLFRREEVHPDAITDIKVR